MSPAPGAWRTAALLALAAPALAQAPPCPSLGLLDNNPYGHMEHLLCQAEKVEGDLTPEKLARLPATPELLAQIVLDPAAGTHLGNQFAAFRRPNPSAYGLYLANQLGLEPRANALQTVYTRWSGTVAAHLATCFWYRQDPRQNEYVYKLVEREDPRTNALAKALFAHRLPLDEAVLERLAAGARAPLGAEPARRVGLLAPRITAGALGSLAPRWPALPKSLRQALWAGFAAIPRSDPRWESVEALGKPASARSATGPVGAPGARKTAVPGPRSPKPTSDGERLPGDLVLYCLAGAGALAFLGWRLAARRAAAVIAFALGLAFSQVAGADDDKALYPELEKLLAEADRVPHPRTPLQFARLATTPELMARLVLDDHVASYLTDRTYNNAKRWEGGMQYGLYLALHVEAIPRPDVLEKLWYPSRTDVVGYLAGHLLVRTAKDRERYRMWWENHFVRSPENLLALQYLTLRMPLDADILEELDRRGTGTSHVTPAQLERLGKLWPLADPSGREYLATRRGNLCPLLSRMVAVRGLPRPVNEPKKK